MIMFIGLGSSPDDMTAKARKAIDAAGVVAVKTKKTAALAAVKKASVTMDDLFETSESFDDLNSAVADRLQSLESSYETVAYCSDGSGLTDGAFKELKSRGANVETIVGVSMGSGEFADAVLKMTATRALELRPYIDGGASVEITERQCFFTADKEKKLRSETSTERASMIFTAECFWKAMPRSAKRARRSEIYCGLWSVLPRPTAVRGIRRRLTKVYAPT